RRSGRRRPARRVHLGRRPAPPPRSRRGAAPPHGRRGHALASTHHARFRARVRRLAPDGGVPHHLALCLRRGAPARRGGPPPRPLGIGAFLMSLTSMPHAELVKKAKAIEWLLLDVDGVF